MKDINQLSKSVLRQFTGSERWYRHSLNRQVLYTDGAKHVAEYGGAFWLLDEIALAQRYQPDVAKAEFQVWKLTVDLVHSTGVLMCENGNCREIFRKELGFTDFPIAEIVLWFTADTIYLPSEH